MIPSMSMRIDLAKIPPLRGSARVVVQQKDGRAQEKTGLLRSG